MATTYTQGITIGASAAEVFAFIDDIHNVAAHMSGRRRAAMMGSRLAVQVVTREPTGVGAVYRYVGNILGLRIDFEERVTKYQPPNLKEWETIGEPRLLVLSRYVMTFTVTNVAERVSQLTISLTYDIPRALPWRWLGRALAPLYARWCVDAILKGTRESLEHAH